MDFELRLATLSKLLENTSDAVQKRLGEELRRVENVLEQSSDYDELEGALKILAVLAPKFHGAVVPNLFNFVRTVAARTLTQGGEPIPASRARHRSASHLIREAIDVPNSVRYVHLEEVLHFLLELSRAADDEVRNKAQQALEDIAKFNLNYFSTLGAGPQAAIVAHLAKLRDEELLENSGAILRVLRTVLSAAMEGHSWTYKTVTITRGAVQSGAGVAEMRDVAIELLKRMYPLKDAVAYRKSVLSTLNSATHRERQALDTDTMKMFERNALVVLEFLRGLVAAEALPLVQKIEHDTYWDYFHAMSTEIESAALAVRDALALRADYQIYKQLIGFEGIFGQWEKLRRSEDEWDYSNTKRQEAARRYVDAINADTYCEWRDRILEFSKTESDDLATFPVYYEFLELIGLQKPDLALDLVKDHEARMRFFLIPLISGLWASERQADIDAIVQRWIGDGTHLEAVAKSLFKGGADRLGMLSSIVARSAELDNRDALIIAMGAAASLHAHGCMPSKAVFMQALRELAKHNDARWARAFWFGRDFKSLVEGMDAPERGEVLASLSSLQELDYQAEEVLHAIGEKDIEAVFGFLAARLKSETTDQAQWRAEGRSILDDKFEAVPYHLHGLKKLLESHPEALVSMLRRSFDDEPAKAMFPYRGGARLVKAVFPEFEAQLQAVLLKIVETGDVGGIDFVVAVVQAYGGGAPILEVCKAIVKVVPEQSHSWNELAAAIETTGVVCGEYGMVHAFELKRDEIAVWKTDESDRVRAFAEWLTGQLERVIDREQQRADEDLAFRKYKNGVGKDEG